MYLFAEDRYTHPGILQTNTKNISFLKMTLILERLGIKNNKFFLWLSQPELDGYDPHNLTDTSIELKQKMVYECKINFFYFLREVLKIPIQGGDPIPYKLDRANLANNWLFLNSIDTFSTQPRQTGKTASAAAQNTWCMYIGYKNSNIGLFAKDSALQVENVSQIKDMRKALPDWMICENTKDLDNREGLSYVALNNEYKTYIAKPDKIAAAKQGRGEKLAREHWDEFCFYINNSLSFPTATSASDAAAAQARKLGLPANNTITSTAGRLADPSGAYAFSIKNNCMRFHEHYYDVNNKEELMEVLGYHSKNKTYYLEYSYKQLGFTDDWFANVTKNKTQEQIEMDYLNRWQLGTGTNIIPKELRAKLTSSIQEPVEYTYHGPLIIKWYVQKCILEMDEHKNKNYLIGLDTADNVGEDFTTMVVTDPYDLTTIAVCRCNIDNFIHVISCVAELLEMFPESILIPERNKNGSVLLDILIDVLQKRKINPFTRIYNTFIQDHNERTPNFNTIDLSDGTNRKHFGFNTTSAGDSRDFLFSKVMISMLNICSTRVHDQDLVDELLGLVIKNGRVDHASNGHNDTCMSWLLTGFFAIFGNNHYLYGIPENSMLCAVDLKGDSVDPDTKERQRQIRKRIIELKSLIKECKNTTIKVSYEREMKHLESCVDDTMLDDPSISVGEIKSKEQSNNKTFTYTRQMTKYLF